MRGKIGYMIGGWGGLSVLSGQFSCKTKIFPVNKISKNKINSFLKRVDSKNCILSKISLLSTLNTEAL